MPSDARFQLLLEGLDAIVWEKDARTGAFGYVSPQAYRLLGFPPERWYNDPAFRLERLVHPDDRERVARFDGAAAEGRARRVDYRAVAADGRVVCLRDSVRAIPDGAGPPRLLSGMTVDVTEEKRTEPAPSGRGTGPAASGHEDAEERAASVREMELAREQAARMRAEEEEQRASLLAQAGRTLSSSLDDSTILRNFARLAVPRIADWCAIDVVDDDGTVRRVVTAHPDPEREELARQLERRYPADPDAALGVPQVLRSGEPELVGEIPPEWIEEGAVDAEHLRLLRALRLRSYMVLPLTARGRILGAITFVSAESGRRYDESDLHFAEELAARAALAVDNARLYQEAELAGRRVRQILESITDAFFAVDREWRFRYLNPEAEALLRRPRIELLGQSLWEALPDATRPSLERGLRQAMEERRTVVFEKFHPSFQSWLEVRVYPAEEGISVYLRNIDERKRAEAEIQRSEQRLRFLADAIPVQVWTATPDGRLDYVNLRTTEYFGRSEAEVVGAGWQAVVDPEQLPEVVARWAHSLATSEPYEVHFRLRGRDGRYRWHLGRAVAQLDAAGRPVRWFGSNTDIEDQKEGEAERERLIAALRIERSRLREIFQQAPAFIATLRGPGHRFETVNPPFSRLIGGRDVLGRTVAESLPEMAEQGFVELLDHVYGSGEPYIGTEVRVFVQPAPGEPGEDRFLNFVYQPMWDADGRVSGIFVHGVDITDQVRARHEAEQTARELARLARELEQSNRELDQFAYVASHDLKAPLRGIANLSQWIEEDLETEMPPAVQEHMTLLRGRVHRMEGLIDGILQYSRAGRAQEEPETVAIGELLEVVIDLLAPPAEVEVHVAGEVPTLTTERLPLQQVFMNLIGNALKHRRPSGARVEVRAELEPEEGFHHFTVSDNGPGIAPEYHERIFGIFQTLEARDRVEGTGIGLSLVKKIVEARGGRVWVESEEGAGASFHFLWPVEADERER